MNGFVRGMHCGTEMFGVEKRVEVCGAKRGSGFGFKLFGSDIPAVSTVAMNIRSKKRYMEDSLVISNKKSCGVSCKQNVDSSDPGEEKPFLDELRSSSGSNDGYEEEKPNLATIGCPPPTLEVAEPGVEAGMDYTDSQSEAKGADGQGDTSQEKTPGKPDKPLPCPRCDSLDTKFCYYNNYNVNQPRHFCKNCQRYWTAGGTLRNVPVGAGRRKNKHSASHQRHVLPDIVAVRGDSVDSAHQIISCSVSSAQSKLGPSHSRLPVLPLDMCSFTALDSPPSSTVLHFGQESPLCESIAATSLALHRANGFQNQRSVSGRTVVSDDAEARTDSCCKSSVDQKPYIGSDHFSLGKRSEEGNASVEWPTTDNSVCGSSVSVQPAGMGNMATEHNSDQTDSHELNTNTEGQAGWEHGAGFMTYGGPWQYGLNMVWSNAAAAAAVACSTGALQSNNGSSSAPTAPPPNTFGWNGPPPGGIWPCVPWPVLHPAMWAPPSEWAGSWSMPWGPAAAAAAAAAAATAAATAATAHIPWLPNTNRKHSMESSHPESGTEGCLWVPKTLRIDDPAEAAQSSIWTTLGLGDRSGSLTVGGAAKAFCSKTETKESEEPAAKVRHTNPAAMTRSMAFHESS